MSCPRCWRCGRPCNPPIGLCNLCAVEMHEKWLKEQNERKAQNLDFAKEVLSR